jgi:hypothetical protein
MNPRWMADSMSKNLKTVFLERPANHAVDSSVSVLEATELLKQRSTLPSISLRWKRLGPAIGTYQRKKLFGDKNFIFRPLFLFLVNYLLIKQLCVKSNLL